MICIDQFSTPTAQSLANHKAGESFHRLFVHVVSPEPGQRAAIARLIFAKGHHAEVYNDPQEFAEHAPADGVIVFHENDEHAATDMAQALTIKGVWLPIVVVTDLVRADRIIDSVKAGILDYHIGPLVADSLIAKIAKCAQEAAMLREQRQRKVSARSTVAMLSQREREVLHFMAEGLTNKETARELGISPRTVEIHRMKMMVKIGAKTGAHAIRILLQANELN